MFYGPPGTGKTMFAKVSHVLYMISFCTSGMQGIGSSDTRRFRAWLFILPWTMPSSPAATWPPWEGTECRRCTKCSIGLKVQKEGKTWLYLFPVVHNYKSGISYFSLLLFVDEADAFLRKRSTVSKGFVLVILFVCILVSIKSLCRKTSAKIWEQPWTLSFIERASNLTSKWLSGCD